PAALGVLPSLPTRRSSDLARAARAPSGRPARRATEAPRPAPRARPGAGSFPAASAARVRAGRGSPCAPRRRRTAARARPARSPTARRARRRREAGAPPSWIDQVGAPVLGVGGLVGPGGARTLLAEAHRFHLRVGHAERRHRPPHRFGALLPEREVVLTTAALVGVALDHDAARRIREQVARMRVDGRSELVAHDEAVEVEVDAALREGAGGIVERVLPFDFHLLDAASVGTAREGAGTLR